jgi:enoyl-CoA hydratase/carnithine racemase
MSEELVTYERDEDIAIIGLNRPDKRNAVNDELMRQLRAAVERAVDEARVGVLFGHGQHFSAGLDLAEAMTWLGADQEARRRRRGRWHPVLDMVARGHIPWVAALHGACIGGGLEIASAAHIRVADETTFFALPEGQRGIFVGGGGSVRIQRLLGYARMADLMLTGRVLTAAEGERYNLCQYVEPAGKSLERARTLAKRIAKNAPLSNWAVAACLPRVNDASHDDGLFMETLISTAVSSDQSLTRLKDFVEKRADRLPEPGKSGDQT